MIDKIYRALESIPNVYHGWYRENINETHVTFIMLSDLNGDYADDEAETNTQLFQIDIWSKVEEGMEDLKKTIKKAMKTLDNCTYSDGADLYEPNTGIYHKALRFWITEDLSE